MFFSRILSARPPAASAFRLKTILSSVMIAGIRFYKKFLSPWLPKSCRFYPTCSSYAVEAIQKYGPGKGGWLAVKRICRCHPFNPGGYDPVP